MRLKELFAILEMLSLNIFIFDCFGYGESLEADWLQALPDQSKISFADSWFELRSTNFSLLRLNDLLSCFARERYLAI